MNSSRIGLYFYPWYCGKKWRELPRLCTPQIGEYDSTSREAIKWQLEGIALIGIDYLVVELPPIGDWSFEVCQKAINLCFEVADELGLELQITFLLDATFISDRSNFVEVIGEQLKLISSFSWDRRMPKGCDHSSLIYVFAPYPYHAESLKSRYESFYDIRFPATFPHWGILEKSFNEPDLYPYIKKAVERGNSLADELGLLGFCQFWSPTQHLLTLNGVASVVPGYDDLHLRRAAQFMPVVPRNSGNTLLEQFKAAQLAGADEILIYSWNEYFEATSIEPTIEYGSYYVELTKYLVGKIKRGEVVKFPEGLDMPKPSAPIYLTEALKRSADTHLDKIPRWDQDYYLAEIGSPKSIEYENSTILFRGISICNIGQRTWQVVTSAHPIRLGVRLFDQNGEVVREGRTMINMDFEPQRTIEIDLRVEIIGLKPGNYQAKIDMVYEGHFWFGCENNIKIYCV